MNKFKPEQQVYFLICGRFVTEAAVIKSDSWFVTIRFRKNSEDCIIRLPYSRIYATEEEARNHIRPVLPPQPVVREETGEYICTRRWELWE